MTLEAHRGMRLLVGGSQLRLKRTPGKARELSIFPEGSGETQGLGVRRGGTWFCTWSLEWGCWLGLHEASEGAIHCLQYLTGYLYYFFYFLGEKLSTQSSEGG